MVKLLLKIVVYSYLVLLILFPILNLFLGYFSDDSNNLDFSGIKIDLSSDSEVDLSFIPADEWIGDFTDPLTNLLTGSSALRGYNVLDIDNGIIVRDEAEGMYHELAKH